MKKYFLFDMDGTLCDTGPGIMGSVQDALGRLGWERQDEAFLRQFVGPPLIESFMSFCGLDQAGAERAIKLYREKYNAWGVYQSPLYRGISGLLERLSRLGTLCVATSKREQGARKILDMRGIEEMFRIVVGDDGSRPGKAQVVEEVLRLLENPAPPEVVMIGDRSYDVVGARACGVETIGAGYGYAAPGELERAGADWIVGSVEELEELCVKLAQE